jgi:hypothetical protein
MPEPATKAAVRVSTCRKCGGRVRAGARGRIPGLCPACRGAPDRQLVHTLHAAARLADSTGRESMALDLYLQADHVETGRPDRFPGE